MVGAEEWVDYRSGDNVLHEISNGRRASPQDRWKCVHEGLKWLSKMN